MISPVGEGLVTYRLPSSFTLAATAGPGGVPNIGTVSGSCGSGTYTRMYLKMHVDLNCSFSINNGPPMGGPATFDLVLEPAAGQNGTTVPITSASAFGSFKV